MQYEYSMETFNLNIRIEYHFNILFEIRSIQTFDYSIRKSITYVSFSLVLAY